MLLRQGHQEATCSHRDWEVMEEIQVDLPKAWEEQVGLHLHRHPEELALKA